MIPKYFYKGLTRFLLGFVLQRKFIFIFYGLFLVITISEAQETENELIESSRPIQRNIFGEEMPSSNDLDDGLHKAAIIQDPENKENIRGFIYIPTVTLYQKKINKETSNNLIGLVEGIESYTLLKAKIDAPVALDSSKLSKYPFVYASIISSELTESEKINLKKYIIEGGFLALKCDNLVLKQLQEYLGNDVKIRSVPKEHSINNSFYDLSTESVRYEGMWIGDELVGIYGHSLGTMWSESLTYEHGIKIGINFVVYSLICERSYAKKNFRHLFV